MYAYNKYSIDLLKPGGISIKPPEEHIYLTFSYT